MNPDTLNLYTEITRVYDVLYRLGLTATYTGFFQASYAVYLSLHCPQRLLLVTKWLYPDVAKHYHTNWHCVERNIRTAVEIAWQNNRPLLEELSGRTLSEKPTAAGFIATLAHYLASNRAA